MRRTLTRPRAALATIGVLAATGGAVFGLGGASADSPAPAAARTPIQHVVVIFGENESFDHYFGTYPNAAHPDGAPGKAGAQDEPPFHPRPDTPAVNGLTPTLLTANPNSSNPQRLSTDQALTCSQNHGYTAEQNGYDGGLMDKFPEFTAGSCKNTDGTPIVMDYFDGNTVTGLWNLAQNYALSDNSYSDNFGPSTVGALNLISGQTHGATVPTASGVDTASDSVIGDPDPLGDDCGSGGTLMTGRNVGDLLNGAHVSWGWFQGGFRPTSTTAGKAVCGSTHQNVAGASVTDYSAHHAPFMYYQSTANPHHLPPASPDEIGHDGQANHEYDLQDFDTALSAGNLPSVSYLKASAYQDAHPGNSDPIDEQHFIAREVNAIERSPQWQSTMIVLAYDDSDGWYDHQAGTVTNPSRGGVDSLNGTGVCGGAQADGAYQGRCGVGPRMPLLVLSPWAKQNYVDHAQTTQTSILRFVEDNWGLGRIGDQSLDAKAQPLDSMLDFDPSHPRAATIQLDETTGVVTSSEGGGPATGPTQTVTTPGPTTTVPGPAVTTPGPTTTVTVPAKAPKSTLKLKCSSSHRKGRTVKVSCKGTGTPPKGRVSVRIRLYRGSRLVATKSGTLKNRKVAVTLRARKALARGSYTLRETVTSSTTVTATKAKVALR